MPLLADPLATQWDFLLLFSGLVAIALASVCLAVECGEGKARRRRFLATAAAALGLSEWALLAAAALEGDSLLTVACTLTVVVATGACAGYVACHIPALGKRSAAAWVVSGVVIALVGLWAVIAGAETAYGIARWRLLPAIAVVAVVLDRFFSEPLAGHRRRDLAHVALAAAILASFTVPENEAGQVPWVRLPGIIGLVLTTYAVWVGGHREAGPAYFQVPAPFFTRSAEVSSFSLVVILVFGWVAVNEVGIQADVSGRHHLLARAQTAASAMAPDEVAAALTAEGEAHARHLRTILQAVRQVNPDSRFIYLMARRGDDVVFVADAEDPDSPDYSLHDKAYGQLTDELRALFGHGQAFVAGPVADAWGTWYSGLAPVREPGTGRVLAVLGIDIAADHWLADIRKERFGAIAVVALACLLALVIGINQERFTAAMRRVVASEQRYHALVEGAPNAIMLFGADGRCQAVNRAATVATGWTANDTVGKHIADLYQRVAGDALPGALASVLGGNHAEFEAVMVSPGGAEATWRVTLSPICDERSRVLAFVAIATDITESRRHEAELQRLARHDSLTGLPNRRLLDEALEKASMLAAQGGEPSVLALDLDNFKAINDSLGHLAGDKALVAVATLVRQVLRDDDFLARTGGDEFAIVLFGGGIRAARTVGRRLCEAANDYNFVHEGLTLSLSLSVGAAMLEAGRPLESLANADAALRQAKTLGRNRAVLHGGEGLPPDWFSTANRTVKTLKEALARDQLVLHYQPVVRLSDRRVEYCEALLRLREASGRLLQPATFLPVAQRYGLMPQITRWVVGKALGELAKQAGNRVFVNLSTDCLQDWELLDFIRSRLRQLGVEPARLGFEITETTPVYDSRVAQRWMESLRAVGCRFALDDFGSGCSAFSHLRELPVDLVKLDGSLIAGLDRDPKRLAVVAALANLGDSLGIQVVAERVENETVARLLLEGGIRFGQGYHLGRPSSVIPGHAPGVPKLVLPEPAGASV